MSHADRNHRCNEYCQNARGREIRRQKGKSNCCFRQLARGKRRLGVRLAQRWVKIQLGAIA
jgi:hypothetical protein